MTSRTSSACRSSLFTLTAVASVLAFSPSVFAQSAPNNLSAFTAGDLVISTVSSYNGGGLDTAAPIVLQEFGLGTDGSGNPLATFAGSLELPQTTVGNQSAISGEYGSASEGLLQQSVNGQYLTMMGYGVNATAFNSAALSAYGTAALGQTSSLTAAAQALTTTGSIGTATNPVTTVPRVVALIGANGSVDTSTALTGVFNNNNPRSVATVDGTSFYVSGQGTSEGDPTEGVAYATLGATTATVIDNSTDTRAVQIINTGSGNTLYVSRDVSVGGGNNNLTNVSTLTSASGGLPTSATGLITTHVTPSASSISSGGNNGSINLTAALANGVNNARIGSFVYLSPEQVFMASATVMYVTDSGEPKNGNANKAALGEGGLQKWVLSNGTWNLAYDLTAGLNLVNNANANSGTPTAAGVTGLLGLAGQVVNGQVELYATSYGLNELSPSFLYTITDNLDATSISQVSGETFTTLDAAATGTSIRGVAFAPSDINVAAVPEPAPWAMLLGGIGVIGFARRKKTPA